MMKTNSVNSEDLLNQAITALEMLSGDPTLPRNFTAKLSETVKLLKQNSETKTKVSKALHTLEEISYDNNIDSMARSQIYNVVSMLEIV